MKKEINIVWLKRDLRTYDHLPLNEAEKLKIDYEIIYLFEPNIMKEPDYSERHQQFIYHSLLDINKSLKKYNREVKVFNVDATELFSYLISNYNINSVLSYQESGTQKTWNRDKKISALLKSNNVKWIEFENQSIIRGLTNRKGWDKKWYNYANSKPIENIYSYSKFNIKADDYLFDIENFKFLKKYPKSFQPAGQSYALKYLKSFVDYRSIHYRNNISKPEKSRISCSRLSTYLAWGNTSVRFVYQYIKNSPNYKKNKSHFTSFISRLKWRSHFIQKFETDCSYEFECVNKGYKKINYANNDEFLDNWKKGKTGFPMVDASMRSLIKKGWLNFRMRAMLVSFLCHHLEQDWKRGVHYLARLFLDYEPGIHYTQFQMQAGVTGINLIRVYNPIKQSKDNDSEGTFLRKWLPELSSFEVPFLHEPWKLTSFELFDKTIPLFYKNPIVSVDLKKTEVTKQLWTLKSDQDVKQESKRLLKLHVRPKNIKF